MLDTHSRPSGSKQNKSKTIWEEKLLYIYKLVSINIEFIDKYDSVLMLLGCKEGNCQFYIIIAVPNV